ncbi:hypothetical protein ACFO0N_15945 [Halobium salinum]|uniref:DUF8052 domain-containing protein n=1 Tax=Halobium salinum TaxID=1364940 RepID=A0ABD5PEY1_9EURY|nr:hypothetical protein [Halobium salinum]
MSGRDSDVEDPVADRIVEDDGPDGGADVDPPATAPAADADATDVEYPEVPDWDDEYLDRVSDRLMFSYDLERDYRVRGEGFDLYGRLLVESQKQLWHPSLNYANHESREHLFARRVGTATVAELDRLVSLAHDLAGEWIERTEEHFGTDFTFVLVADGIPDDVREYVAGFDERTLLRFGYYGHYRVNLAVVAPEGVGTGSGDAVASAEADVVDAFTLWREVPVDRGTPGLFQRFVRRLWE